MTRSTPPEYVIRLELGSLTLGLAELGQYQALGLLFARCVGFSGSADFEGPAKRLRISICTSGLRLATLTLATVA